MSSPCSSSCTMLIISSPINEAIPMREISKCGSWTVRKSSCIEGPDKPIIITGRSKMVDRLCLIFAWSLLLLTLPLSLFFCVHIVSEYKRVVIFRLGRLLGSKGPGIVLTLPMVDERKFVDLRVRVLDVPLQEMLTCDSLVIAVNAVVYYRLSDPIASLNSIKDPYALTRNLTQTTLRNVIGSRTLSEVVSDRQDIAVNAAKSLDQGMSYSNAFYEIVAFSYYNDFLATRSWGISIDRLDIGDVMLPRSLCRVMAQEAEAVRVSKANILRAKGEFQASSILLEAADVLSSSKGAIQLRFIQTLGKLSAMRNNTVVLPVPSELPDHSRKWLRDRIRWMMGRSNG
ncbi:hypothetical protein PRIPAC_71150 [Pristionchus pacificus]|uniref:PHB domain-containing protein n=1 Tax=Pristionchus pacificus TaxID=54126 RepID=A0A2A6CEP9_PRIPA|nr:hypothetical protein PRIPAC_71150 [Pristionchus pacificus]|eukprot:PDM76715.1 hypothetical protein PRIPAC_42110 [Pristionchus pacificus]